MELPRPEDLQPVICDGPDGKPVIGWADTVLDAALRRAKGMPAVDYAKRPTQTITRTA